ncbi:hypothetical protein ACSTLM_00300, partial [Vibrio parahaemolyticus]
YNVSNVLVMTFDAEGSDAQTTPGQQPSIIPDPGALQRQNLHSNVDQKKKRPVRLIMAVQRSE